MDEIQGEFPGKIVHQEPINGAFAAAIGDYGILARSPDHDEIEAMAIFILAREDGG
jgi:hypothetical protein